MRSLCRSLALSLLGIGISTGLLIVTSRADTVLLFAGRACSMGSFAILYVYTPEVHALPCLEWPREWRSHGALIPYPSADVTE